MYLGSKKTCWMLKGNVHSKMIFCHKLHFFVWLKNFFTELKNYVSFLRYWHFYIFSWLLKCANYDVIMNIITFRNICKGTFFIIFLKLVGVSKWNLVNIYKKIWRTFSNNFFAIFVNWKLVPGPFPILQKLKYLKNEN